MGVDAEQVVSQGDVLRRLRAVEKEIERLHADRRLESASIGAGGLRLAGGRLLAEDAAGERVFEVTTDPAAIFMRPELVQDVVEAILSSPAGATLVEGIVANLIGSPAGSTLIRGLIGEASESDFESSQVDTSSTSWQNLGGPSVTVDITDSGAALVEFGAVTTATPGEHAAMSFQVSGATSQSPSGERAAQLQTDSSSAVVATLGLSVLVTGLNPGTHTFSARYTTFLATGSGFWANRYLIVTPY